MITARSSKPNLFTPDIFGSARSQTLPQRLLSSVLPIVLVPLFAAGGIGYYVARNNGLETALTQVHKNSAVISLATQSIFKSKNDAIDAIRQSPEVSGLFDKAAEIVASEDLRDIDLRRAENIAALEKRFAGLKQLAPDEKINAYLKRLVEMQGLSEMFITDRNGFTLAAGDPTPDFVQSDEEWWKTTKTQGSFLEQIESDASSQQSALTAARKIYDANEQESLGVVRIGLSTEFFQQELAKYLEADATESAVLQLLDINSNRVVTTITKDTVEPKDATDEQQDTATDPANQTLMGGQPLEQAAAELVKAYQGGFDQAGLAAFQQKLNRIDGLKVVGDLYTERQNANQYRVTGALIAVGDRYYSLSPVTGTDLVAISSESAQVIEAAGRESLAAFASSSVFLSLIGAFCVVLLAANIAKPVLKLTQSAEEVADGKLDLRVEAEGTAETRTLARSFNHLLDQVQSLLQQQEALASEQSRRRQELEDDMTRLMEDVGDASEGDLTVRAQLSASDVGIIADLFNSIIENLRDTAMQVKSASGQVSTSLDVNAAGIRSLATQAITEANTLRQTMKFVEGVSESIQTVAHNADEASQITNETYATVQDGNEYMDKTVNSILSLRSTVGETAKKIKRLGESAQKISQTVSLIDEIALKTNLLAVNASVEAARAGELGQGFTAVAEQVGALAEQSASATKEIAQIVAAIQAETQEVVGAIETGTAQVVDSTQLVESTKQRLSQVLQKSAQINQLMQSISESTTAQTNAAAIVTKQVKSATLGSEQRAKASEQMAKAIQDTAEIARSMQALVAQFKVDSTSTIEEHIPSLDVHAETIEEAATTA